MAVEHPVPFQLPPSRLRSDAPLAKVLRRAMALAEERGSELVSRADLLGALAEAEAVAAGLDLGRLRFARFWLGRAYPDSPPARRHVNPAQTTPRNRA